MSFFVEKPVTTKATTDAVMNPGHGMDMITNAEMVVKAGPHYAQMFDRLKEERAMDTGKMGEFKKVAELMVPHELAVRIIQPDFLKNKKVFYSWLDRNPQYAAYDRRRQKRISDRFFQMGAFNGQA